MLTRRRFIRLSAGGLASVAIWPHSLTNPDASRLVVAVLGSAGPLGRGVALGLSEARHAAGLLRREVASLEMRTGSVDEIDRAKRDGAQVLVLAERRPDAAKVAAACTNHGLIFINASMSDNGLRREGCGPLVFHVAASESMVSAARDRSQVTGAEVLMWHPSLVRFGAAQLNDRFAHSQRLPMTSDAWAGWMAVKVAWEAYLRAPVATSAGIAEYLARDTTNFDGHKGVPLSFRKWDHQLRQPLYLAGAGDAVTEVPAQSGPAASLRELLDTIGDPPGVSRCTG